jgi:hypothetical protein
MVPAGESCNFEDWRKGAPFVDLERKYKISELNNTNNGYIK